MTKNIKYWISGLLILSSGLLVSLIPGGSIETRDFSHINPIILGAFNAFPLCGGCLPTFFDKFHLSF